MSLARPLRGGCSCGRNHYVVNPDSSTGAEVFFDDSSESRRSQATPLTAWLRVPLASYRSQTVPFYPDETHSSIRRSFTPRHAPHCKRVFCGFCGTQLSFWSEQPQGEADYINVTLGSLIGEDLRELEELGLMPLVVSQSVDITEPPQAPDVSSEVTRSLRQGSMMGLPWFNDLIKGSRLGREGQTRRGMGLSADGSTTVEWEVSEWVDDGSQEESSSGTKRKVGETDGEEKDVDMRRS